MSQVPLAFFDVDGTLLQGDCGVLFTMWCARHGLLSAQELATLAGWCGRRLLSPASGTEIVLAKIALLTLQVRLGEERALALFEACFHRWAVPRQRQRVVALLKQHQNQGPVFLITANLRCFALTWGRYLGVPEEHCFGVEGEREAGNLTARLRNFPLMGIERARLVEEIMRGYGASPGACSGFGNSDDDLPMLEELGHPHVVCPNRALRRIAIGRGWTVVDP